MCIGADGVLYELGVVLCEQVGGERGLYHIAVGADPCTEEDWRNDEVPVLLQLVAGVGVCAADWIDYWRCDMVLGAVVLDDHREVAVGMTG